MSHPASPPNGVQAPATRSKTAGYIVLTADIIAVVAIGILLLAGVRTSYSVGGGALIVAIAALYLLPALVGVQRRVANLGSVVVINVLLGWTLAGWVVALAMAVRDRTAVR